MASPGKIYARDLLIRSLQLYAMSLYKVSRRGDLARSLYKISKRGLLARLLKRSFYKRSPQKISVGDLKVRFFSSPLSKLSEQDRCSLHQVSDGLCTRSLQEVSWQHLCTRSRDLGALLARSLYKLPTRGLLARFTYEQSGAHGHVDARI